MTKSNIFSINTAMMKPVEAKIKHEIESINERLNNIYERAQIKEFPVVESMVAHFRPSPEECVMLSKVFERLAGILAELYELEDKLKVLQGINSHSDWLYSEVGDTKRDVEAFLNSFNTEKDDQD